MSFPSRGWLFGVALLVLGGLVAGMVPLSAQPVNDSAPNETFKALTRGAIEELGREKGETPPGSDTNNTSQLTKGLNQLANSGWEVIAIEQGRTQPITGPSGSTLIWPPTYIFQKK